MILPGKHMRDDRALISVGADVLSVLHEASSVSQVWDGVRQARATRGGQASLPFDWFIMALTLLFAMGAIEWDGDLIGPRRD